METESKFIVPDEAAFARLRTVGAFGKYRRADERTKQVHDRYLDTRGRAFLKAGWCLRLREGADGSLLVTLKSINRHPLATAEDIAIQARDEYETSVAGLRIATWPESEAKRLAAKIAGRQVLRDLVTIDQVRTVSYLYDGERVTTELSLDEIDFHVATGGHGAETHRAYELEAELLPDGTVDDLVALARVFTEKYGLDPQPYSKFERALRFACLPFNSDRAEGSASKPPKAVKQSANAPSPIDAAMQATPALGQPEPSPQVKPPKPRAEIHRTDSMAAAARKIIAHNYKALLDKEVAARTGEDPMAVHDMRVASRRMRAVFRVFGPYLTGKRAKEVRDVLRVLATELGAVRDLDVLIANAEAFRDSLPSEQSGGLASMIEEWRVTRWKARKSLLRLLDSKEYSKFKQNMTRFLEEPTPPPDQTDGAVPYQVRHAAGSVILAQYEAVRAIEALPNPPTIEQLHALRITGKYFRYTLEFFRDTLPKDVNTMIRDVTKMQDQLGEMHDAGVAATLIREFADQRARRLPGEESPTAPGLDAYFQDRTDAVNRKKTEYEATWRTVTSPDWRKRLALVIAG